MANANSLFNSTSRFVHGGQTETQNRRIEWWERTIFQTDDSDSVYVVENNYEGRLDLIAAVFYGEPRYWWFIAQYNNVLDAFAEITAGTILYIPTKSRMMLMLSGTQGGIPSTREQVPSIPPVIV